MEIERVFVVGAGFMGNGIAQTAALGGYRVTMQDINEERLDAGMDAIEDSLSRLLKRERVTSEQRDTALANLATTTDLADARDADLVAEAAFEDIELKRRIFGELDRVCPARTLLASNTSAIPISALAAATARPERVAGIHFFGPVPLMRLVEVVRGLRTSEETFQTADAWARSLGKETVLVQRDHAGFIANRLNVPASLEMAAMVERGVMTAAEIDRVATFGVPGAIGPMEIVDNAGIDVTVLASTAIYNDTRDPKFYPPPLLRRMVAAGALGRKAGKAFDDWSSGHREEYELVPAAGGRCSELLAAGAGDAGAMALKLFAPTIVEAILMIECGIAEAEDIDKATRLGFNFPAGPLEMADNMGLDTVLAVTSALYEETEDRKFSPPPLLKRMAAAGWLGRKSGSGFYVYE